METFTLLKAAFVSIEENASQFSKIVVFNRFMWNYVDPCRVGPDIFGPAQSSNTKSLFRGTKSLMTY